MPTMKYGHTQIEPGQSIHDIADQLVNGTTQIGVADLCGRHIGCRVVIECEVQEGWFVPVEGILDAVAHGRDDTEVALKHKAHGAVADFVVSRLVPVEVGGQFECD